MASPLTHGLVAMAAFGTVSWGLGLPPVTPAFFLAAALSMLADLGERPDHSAHPPWGHSVLGLLVAASAAGILAVTLPGWAGELPLVVLAGLGTHLLLDVFSLGGVYAFPRRQGGAWRWRGIRWRLRYGDEDPLYNLCAAAPAVTGLVALLAR